ncbi:MAG: nitrogen fixation protein FixH [Gammaproteobacteria bacterium]|nr:nitrogen fixation protein FixH [Gammaproteobacteria bacterium]
MNTPWYKQFWPWFLISLPLSAVVGGIATLIIAMHSPNAMVVDDYYKEGLAINETLARERAAAQRGLSGLLRHAEGSGQLQLELMAEAAATAPGYLQLQLVHPTLAEKDQSLRLESVGGYRYVSQMPQLAPGNWHLILSPPDGSWRLTGRLVLPQGGQARLTPGV